MIGKTLKIEMLPFFVYLYKKKLHIAALTDKKLLAGQICKFAHKMSL